MKTSAILFVPLFFIGFFATAQKPHKAIAIPSPEVYVNPIQYEKHFIFESKHISMKGGKDLVRLYKYKNSRVKKALSFTTPRDRGKLA